MAFLPKTAIGLIGFIIFSTWLISLMFAQQSPILSQVSSMTQNAQTNIVNAGNQVKNSTGGWSGTYDSISGVFIIGYNLFIMVFGYIAELWLDVALFASAITDLPLNISVILLAMVSVGLIFALLSKVIET